LVSFDPGADLVEIGEDVGVDAGHTLGHVDSIEDGFDLGEQQHLTQLVGQVVFVPVALEHQVVAPQLHFAQDFFAFLHTRYQGSVPLDHTHYYLDEFHDSTIHFYGQPYLRTLL